MKVDREIVNKRRNEIMLAIQKLGSVNVSQLTQQFHVSEVTIRRDLMYWENRGAIQRNYGGARIIQHMVDINDVSYTNDLYKHALAKYAAQFVEEGDTIFINTSSTALLMIRYIKNTHCTVITNNAKVLSYNHDPLVQIVLTGGELRFPKEAMVGDFALSNIYKVNATKCFLGCSGITAQNGITTAIMAETTINEAMLKHTSGKRYIICDHTKVGVNHQFISSDISEINCLITDNAANEEEVANLRSQNIEVVQLEPLIRIPEF